LNRISDYFDDGPDPLPLQPEPVQALVSRLTIRGQIVTAIARSWAPGDTRRCLLCPECDADHGSGTCLKLTTAEVPRDPEAALFFDTHGIRVVDPSPEGGGPCP
jgi:hypothetical protein